MFPSISVDFPTRRGVDTKKQNRRDPWGDHCLILDCFLLWGSGGWRSHGKGGTLKEKIFK